MGGLKMASGRTTSLVNPTASAGQFARGNVILSNICEKITAFTAYTDNCATAKGPVP
jgi:hypothetical protein